MSDLPLLLDTASAITASFANAGAEVVRTSEEVVYRFSHAPTGTQWIASPDRLEFLTRTLRDLPVPEADAHQALLGFEQAEPEPVGRRAFLASYFPRLVFVGNNEHYLPTEQMAAVMLSDRPGDYVIGGMVDHVNAVVLLYRGTLAPLPVPFDAFRLSGTTVPDFRRFRVSDYGQVLEFGDYVASVEGILYERDLEVRRHVKVQRRALDPSFGGAFRRLRIQRGLTQRDFEPGLSEREVRRIETGETPATGIQVAHQVIIARMLGVPFKDIVTY